MDVQREALRLYAAVRRGLREAQPWPSFFERFDLAKDWPSLERVSHLLRVNWSVRPQSRLALTDPPPPLLSP